MSKESVRSDYLRGVIAYAIEQVATSGGEINPLAFESNEDMSDLKEEEIIGRLHDLLFVLEDLVGKESTQRIYYATKD